MPPPLRAGWLATDAHGAGNRYCEVPKRPQPQKRRGRRANLLRQRVELSPAFGWKGDFKTGRAFHALPGNRPDYFRQRTEPCAGQ